MKPYKAIVAAIGTFVTVLATAFADDIFDANDWANVGAGLITAVITIYGVWRTSNVPNGDK